MASVSTLKDIDQPSDSRTNGYFTDRTVSGGRERQLRELDGKGEETLADLTSWLKEHSPSSQTLVSKRQFQNNKDWVIDERVLDSTDMPSDKMSSERMEESVPPPPLTRADRITAILLRDETL